ncbi:MAG TPA: hypothetical protein VMU77_07720 [Acidimicrobiales bacterium]|nr:hypothetical protein [Acidimicrobiales bacterium]
MTPEDTNSPEPTDSRDSSDSGAPKVSRLKALKQAASNRSLAMQTGGNLSGAGGGRNGRLGRNGKPEAPVPADLEKWELRGGFVSAFLSLIILIYFLESIGLHFGVKMPVAHHKNTYRIQHYNLVPEFWIGVGLSIATLFATYFNKRQILAIVIIFSGLMLVSFASQFDPLIPLPFVIFGVWLMLRASRRTRQVAAAGGDPRSANRSSNGSRGGTAAPKGPDSSKRYTPPKPKKKGPVDTSGSVGIGRGGMIKGDLPKKSSEDEQPEGLLGRFAGRKRDPDLSN